MLDLTHLEHFDTEARACAPFGFERNKTVPIK